MMSKDYDRHTIFIYLLLSILFWFSLYMPFCPLLPLLGLVVFIVLAIS